MSQMDETTRQELEAEAGREPEHIFDGIPDTRGRRRSPWLWVPTAYFAEGIPYVVAMTLSVIMYKKLGISNEMIGLWTSLLYLPWTIKPLWGPLVDMYWTKRNWVLWMQVFMEIVVGAGAFAVNLPIFFKVTIILFFALAFFSATHDIACDGFYMLGLSEGQQSWFVGIRSAFYRLAMIFANGILVVAAGMIEARTGLPPVSMSAVAVREGIPAAEPLELQYPAARLENEKGQRILLDAEHLVVRAGETANLHIRLSEPPPPGKPVAVTFERIEGRNTLDVAQGSRIEFTTENWDVPTTVVLKASSNLRISEAAEFRATAGNIRLSWTVVLGLCAAMFLLFYLWHNFALPYPFADRPVQMEGPRPPFYQPAFWLTITGLLCFALLGDLMGVIAMATNPLKALVIEKFTKFQPAQWESLIKVFRILVLSALLVWLFLRQSARRVMGATFSSLARESGLAFDEVFISFFRKPGIGLMLAFLLLYRLGEAQLVKMAAPFLLDAPDTGGLGLSTGDVGIAYGTVGLISLTVGGILGGLMVSSGGLRKWLFIMCCAINLPDLLYVYMSFARPDHFGIILTCVGIEQFGYGVGFTAYMVYMLYCAQGEHKTAHFAITTAFMALGMMIPGMISGFLQAALGYPKFFILVCVLTLPGFLLLPFIPLERDFGKKREAEK